MNVHISKQGLNVFTHELEDIRTITLNRLVMYYNFYNIPKDITVSGTELESGYYDEDELRDKLNPTEDEIKQTTNLNVPGISENGFDYLDPLVFYLYIDEIDDNYNFVQGEKSKLMCTIPVTAKEFGDIIVFEPRRCTKLTAGIGRSMHVEIKDKHGKLYQGKFEAEFTLCP